MIVRRRGLTKPLLLLTGLAVMSLSCAGTRELTYHQVRSSRMSGARLSYSVWLPPDFREDERLPLITFLHGGGDSPTAFDKHGLSQQFREATARGELPRAVIFFPQGDNGFWANWHDGSRLYQDWILEELIPEVQRRYHTRACPEDCHIMGVSMGGYGSLRMVMDHPGRFASLTAISAPIFDTEQMMNFATDRMTQLFIPVHRVWGPVNEREIRGRDPFLVWRSTADLHGTRVALHWGSEDRGGIKDTNERLHEHFVEQRIPHTAAEYQGNHSWVSWSPVIQQALRDQLGHTAPTGTAATEPASSPPPSP
jgi:enterochelin esterase-like enzyme